MSSVDIAQTQKYKTMLGLTNINSTTDTTTFVAQVTIIGGLYISSNSNLLGNTTILSNLNISGYTILNNNISFNSNLYVNNNSIFNSDVSINSNLNCQSINTNGLVNISNISLLNNVSTNNNINVSGLTQFNGNLNINNLESINNTLNINGNNINIGNINSTINILGTTTYFATNEIKVLDKVIALNLQSSSLSTTNNGEYCGIQIYSSSGIGFIRTNSDATRYEIKAPQDDTINYIATVDYNNNLDISGTTILYGPATTCSILNVNGYTIFKGNTVFNSSLITSGNTILQNSVTMLSDTIILGNTNLYNNTTINSSFSVNGNALFNALTTISSSLNINGDTTILGSITLFSDLNIFGNSLLQSSNFAGGGYSTLNSNLYVSGISIIQGTTTIGSTLNINGLSNILGSTTISSNLNVSDTTILQGSSNLNSRLNVNGNTIIGGNMTIGSIFNFNSNNISNFSNLYILGQMISQLPEYATNSDAISNSVPLWGFYRTGGVLKIRLDDTPPILLLSGNSTIIISYTSPYTDPGITYTDTIDQTIIPYLISIANTFVSNIITTQIPIIGTNTFISQTSILPIGIYNISYSATDTTGNIGYTNRTLNIVNNIISTIYTNSNIVQTWQSSGTAYTITNGELIGGQYGAWAFDNSFISGISFNGSWSVVLKARAISWGNSLQINFDPSFTNWSQGLNSNSLGSDCGISNVYFRDSSLYFSNDSTYWQSTFPPSNFYSDFNSMNGIYIQISRNQSTGILTISFYDNSGNLIDSQNSLVPFFYTRYNSLFAFTSSVSIYWLKGFIIHTIDTQASITEFQNYFGS